jgi:hypothetical protein
MKLSNFPQGITDWSQVPTSEHPGASGTATVQTRQIGDIQLRRIVYSANYKADHWCHKGHIVFVLEGQLIMEHQQDLTCTLTPGTSYHVADDEDSPHRVLSETGATIFVMD